MKHIIIGTAGHVDHGKTALIRALTGVDTDRLKEEPAACKHRRFQEEAPHALRVRESSGPLDLLERAIHEAGYAGISAAALAAALQRPVEEVRKEIRVRLEEEDLLSLSIQAVAHRERWETLTERVLQALDAFHRANPLREWMPREDLRTRTARAVPGGSFAAQRAHSRRRRLRAPRAQRPRGDGQGRAHF